MKFVHIADMHFDSPFTNLASSRDMGEIRRLDQRRVFKEIIEYIKQNDIDYLFISGDLYEQKHVRQSTIDYINNLFKEIPNTKILVVPGNHDPFLKNSYYNNYNWNSNVKVFNREIEKICYEDINIYGSGFNDFYLENSEIENIVIDEPEKINILLTHGSLNASDKLEKLYNPISENKLEELGFDYIALGHIHKPYYNEKGNQKIVYPGSTVAIGFDELGDHGMITGELEKNKLEIKFIKLDNKYFIEKEIDISEINSWEELIEYLNNLETNDNYYMKIVLIGKRNFEINLNNIFKLINKKSILKIKNRTRIKYNLEEISKENNLRGIFVTNMLQKMNDPNYDKNEIEIAIEVGLDSIK